MNCLKRLIRWWIHESMVVEQELPEIQKFHAVRATDSSRFGDLAVAAVAVVV